MNDLYNSPSELAQKSSLQPTVSIALLYIYSLVSYPDSHKLISKLPPGESNAKTTSGEPGPV